MDPGEVGEVHIVLDTASGARLPLIGRQLDYPVRRIRPLRKLRQRETRLLQADPDQPAGLGHPVGLQPGPAGDVVTEPGRDLRAHPIRAISPAVIGAAQLAALHPAQRQRGAPVRTQVGEAADLTRQPGQHHRLLQQHRPPRRVGELGGIHHRMPEPPHRPVQPRLTGHIQLIGGQRVRHRRHLLGRRSRDHSAAPGRPAPRPGSAGSPRPHAGR